MTDDQPTAYTYSPAQTYLIELADYLTSKGYTLANRLMFHSLIDDVDPHVNENILLMRIDLITSTLRMSLFPDKIDALTYYSDEKQVKDWEVFAIIDLDGPTKGPIKLMHYCVEGDMKGWPVYAIIDLYGPTKWVSL